MAKPLDGFTKSNNSERKPTGVMTTFDERLYPCPNLSRFGFQANHCFFNVSGLLAIRVSMTSTSSHVPNDSVLSNHGCFSTRATLIGWADS